MDVIAELNDWPDLANQIGLTDDNCTDDRDTIKRFVLREAKKFYKIDNAPNEENDKDNIITFIYHEKDEDKEDEKDKDNSNSDKEEIEEINTNSKNRKDNISNKKDDDKEDEKDNENNNIINEKDESNIINYYGEEINVFAPENWKKIRKEQC